MYSRSLLLTLLAALPLLSASRCTTPPEPTEKHWFVLAGQSNMRGSSSQATPIAPGGSWRIYQDGELFQTPLVDPYIFTGNANLGSHSSAWPQFALSYDRAEARFIATARGNQCLATDVDHENAGAWDPRTGWLYARTLQIWQDRGEPPLKAFLWLQGECEAQHWHNEMLARGETPEWRYQHSFDHYRQALVGLAKHVRKHFGVPVIAAPISLKLCRWDNVDCDPAQFLPSEKGRGVHDATIAAAAASSDILLGPSSDDLRTMPDNAHTWDVNALGERWAQAVMASIPE